MRVCLFEDAYAPDLEPLALTRPVFALFCGCAPLADKQLFHFAATEPGFLVRPWLASVVAERASYPVNDLRWLGAAPVVLVNGRWLPPADRPALPSTPSVGLVDGAVAWAFVTPEMLAACGNLPLDACLDRFRAALPGGPAGGKLIKHLWDLVDLNGDMIERDAMMGQAPPPWKGDSPAIVGPRERLFVDPSARIEPHVVVDTTNGPVVIDREAFVSAFSRLEGPCYIGPRTQVMGAKIRGGTTLGPECRIGGEVEASIVQGFSNKYHEGFLGHAYIGSWANLGAGTHNSDLRNDYGEVRVMVGGRLVRTARNKVGCYIGDHAKAGLGCLLNTGTSAGAFSQLLPSAGFLPRYVPSFSSAGPGGLAAQDDLDALLATARVVMARRGKPMSAASEALYRQLFDQTARERLRALREADRRRVRLSA